MAEDISRRTLAVLVVLVILVTLFGTWAVLNSAPDTVIRSQDQAKGVVMLQIAGDAPTHEPVSATGNVVLNIAS
jgi:hypothetical protein